MADINDLGLPHGLPTLAGTGSPMACFCSGRCRELGYCPNQGFQGRDFRAWARGQLPPPYDGKGYTLHAVFCAYANDVERDHG
jgi:hypothetical protein